ncbi:hypothetical protein A2U01_0006823, partial [Trifolium medium]|nr:hypothetical protein [Trifolium medium]
SNCSDLLNLDPEIERTLHTRRREILANTNESDFDSDSLHSFSLPNLFDSELDFDYNMAAEQTLSGLAGEDPHKHLKEFQVVCSTPLRPEGIIEDHYFYEGLLPMDRNILDAPSGGALVDKTPAAAKALIENMSFNSQQFSTRGNSMTPKGVNEIQASPSNKAVESRLDELTSLVKQLALGKTQTERVCGICTSPEHPTDTCPILQDDSITELPQAYAANVYNQGNNQNRYNTPDLSTNRYNPNWRNHPLLRYGNPTAHQQQPRPQQQLQLQLPTPAQNAPLAVATSSGPSLEDLIKQMAV